MSSRRIECQGYRLSVIGEPTKEPCQNDAVAKVNYTCDDGHLKEGICWCLDHLKKGASAGLGCATCNTMGQVKPIHILDAEHLLPPVKGI